MYKKYISVKLVEVDTDICKTDDTGRILYKVKYQDGYISFVPKDVFESGQYIPADVLGIDKE